MVELYAKLFLQTLYRYRRGGRFQLHALVLMPEHVHLLFTPADGITLERVVRLIKGGYSHEFGTQFGRTKEVWQRGFTDHRIRDARDFEAHREYIHQNPIEGRLVQSPCDYRYCSLFPGFKLDAGPQRLKPRDGIAFDGTSGTRALPQILN